jgi:PAS domain S-box-containing protein
MTITPAELFLAGAILLQTAAAIASFRLVRITGRLSAWILISVALLLMAVRRVIPFARALLGDGGAAPDPLNEFIGLLLSGFMLAGITQIGPIFERIFRSERELEKSERRFRSYFELPLVGVAIAAPEGRWLTVNDRLCDMLDFSREELSSMSVEGLTFAEDAEREHDLIRRVLEGKADGFSMDKRIIRKDGTMLWASQAVRLVRGAAGAPDYFVVIIQDITERKGAEDGLRRSLNDKEALLRELYHRTKNNMQMICSLLRLESTQSGNPMVTEEFHTVENRIFSMSLVHEMLYLSRDLSNIDLAEYIGDLSRLLMQSYGIPSGKVTFELDSEAISLPIDRAIPIGLMLNELITNALKHAFPGERNGRIRIRAQRKEGNLVELLIEDDGVGMAGDFETRVSMGINTVRALGEQLGGVVRFGFDGGFACSFSFRNDHIPSRI